MNVISQNRASSRIPTAQFSKSAGTKAYHHKLLENLQQSRTALIEANAASLLTRLFTWLNFGKEKRIYDRSKQVLLKSTLGASSLKGSKQSPGEAIACLKTTYLRMKQAHNGLGLLCDRKWQQAHSESCATLLKAVEGMNSEVLDDPDVQSSFSEALSQAKLIQSGLAAPYQREAKRQVGKLQKALQDGLQVLKTSLDG